MGTLDVNINPHATARERFDIHRPRITAIANVLPFGQEVETTDDELGEMLGLKRDAVAVTRRMMIHIGALSYVTPSRVGGRGRWRLLLDGDELLRAVDLEMERQMRGGISPEAIRHRMYSRKGKSRKGTTPRSAEKVAVIEDRIGLPVGAVVGPDAPAPLALSLAPLAGSGARAPEALVLAAKQYRAGLSDDSTRKAQELVKQLSEIGVPVPKELAERAAPKKDERLEAIGLVLPYIEALERQLATAERTLKDQADYGTLRQTIQRQRDQIQRLVTERTAEAMRQTTTGRN